MKNSKPFSYLTVILAVCLAALSPLEYLWGQERQESPAPVSPSSPPSGVSGATSSLTDGVTSPSAGEKGIPQAAVERATGPVYGRKTSSLSARRRTSTAATSRRSLSQPEVEPAATEPAIDSNDLPDADLSGAPPASADPVAASPSADASVTPASADSPSVPVPGDSAPSAASDSGGPAKTVPPRQVEHSEPVSAGSDFLMVKAAGGLGVVLGLIALMYFGARKYFPKYFGRQTAEKSLKLIETLAVGEKRSITIIEFDNQRFVLGNTPNQITLLAAFPGKMSVREEKQPAQTSSFELSKAKVTSDSFQNLYDVEKTNGRGIRKPIPPDIQAKMRQLRESLER